MKMYITLFLERKKKTMAERDTLKLRLKLIGNIWQLGHLKPLDSANQMSVVWEDFFHDIWAFELGDQIFVSRRALKFEVGFGSGTERKGAMESGRNQFWWNPNNSTARVCPADLDRVLFKANLTSEITLSQLPGDSQFGQHGNSLQNVALF